MSELGYGFDSWKGTKEEFALYIIESHMIPSAKDYDNTEEEFALKLLVEGLKARDEIINIMYDALVGITEEPWSMSDDPALRSGHIAFQAIKKADKIRSESE